MESEKRNFQKLDKPFSVRVPHALHESYKHLSGYERKEIQFKVVRYLKKLVKERGQNESA